MLPILNLGPLAIQFPGLLLLAGVWFASTLAERTAVKLGVSPSDLTNLIFYSLIIGVIGARLGYVLRFISIYLENPLGLISLNPSTLSLEEGLLAGMMAALIYGQRRGLPFWSTLDSLAPGLAAFSVSVGLAHLASGDAFGAVTDLPWGMQLWGARRHPTQIYETLLALATLVILLRISPNSFFPGFAFLTWVGLASASQLLIVGFRGDSVIVFGVIRQTQLISLVLLLAAMIGIHLRARSALLPSKA